MRNYGNNRGLVIETKTIVSDVPMTDCFYVRDVLLVERNTEENGGGWLVNIRFEIVFVKSTMFRSLISRTTTGEFNAFMKDLAGYLDNLFDKSSVPLDLQTEATAETNAAVPEVSMEDKLQEQWETVCSKFNAYPEAPVVDMELVLSEDATLETFVETFFQDNADCSYGRFMTEIVGDSSVTATRWVADDNDSSTDGGKDKGFQTLTRSIEYTHPVNAPMAPPQAQARKEQTMRNYGNNRGLVIETKTIVSDVPMTDCFYVRDVLLVERNTEENGGGWLVNIRFEIVFVKSTMFRSLISRTTTGEFNAFMKDLAAFLVTNCGGTAAASTLPAEEEPTGDNNPALLRQGTTDASHGDGTPSGSGRDYATLGWKLVSVVLLVWIATAQGQIWNETRLLRDELKTWKDSLPEIWDETGSHLDEFLLPEIRNEARTLRDRLVHAFNVSRPEPVVQAPPPMEVPVDTPMDIPRPTAQGGFSFLLDVAAGALFLWGSFFLMVFGGSFLSSIKNLDERSDDTHAPKTTTTNLRPKLEESSPSPFSSLTSPSSIARGQLLPIGSDENTTTAS